MEWMEAIQWFETNHFLKLIFEALGRQFNFFIVVRISGAALTT